MQTYDLASTTSTTLERNVRQQCLQDTGGVLKAFVDEAFLSARIFRESLIPPPLPSLDKVDGIQEVKIYPNGRYLYYSLRDGPQNYYVENLTCLYRGLMLMESCPQNNVIPLPPHQSAPADSVVNRGV